MKKCALFLQFSILKTLELLLSKYSIFIEVCSLHERQSFEMASYIKC